MVTKFLQNLCCLPIRLIFRFFFGYQVKTGMDYKDLPKPLIIIANHDTWFDAFLAGVAFPVFSKIFEQICSKSAFLFSHLNIITKSVKFCSGIGLLSGVVVGGSEVQEKTIYVSFSIFGNSIDGFFTWFICMNRADQSVAETAVTLTITTIKRERRLYFLFKFPLPSLRPQPLRTTSTAILLNPSIHLPFLSF